MVKKLMWGLDVVIADDALFTFARLIGLNGF